MKIKYTLVYEVEIPDNSKEYSFEEIGYIKALNIDDIKKRYSENEVKILFNDYELKIRGNALKMPE